MSVSRTKIIAVLIVGAAVLNLVIDALNGGGVNFQKHFDEIGIALGGAGLWFLRDAVGKTQTK